MIQRIWSWLQFLLGCLLGSCCLVLIADQLLSGQAHKKLERGTSLCNCTVVQRLEGNGLSHWDERGVRATGNPAPSGPGPTVLMVGDSMTQATQVHDVQTFCSVAERLARRPDWSPRLLNVGFGSLSAADYVRQAPSLRKQLRPDWTVLVVDDHDFQGDGWDGEKFHFRYAGHQLSCEPGQSSNRTPFDGLPPMVIQGCFDLLYRLGQTRAASLNQVAFSRLHAIRARLEGETPLFEGGRPRPVDCGLQYPLSQELDLLHQAYGDRLTVMVRPYFWFKLKVYSFNDEPSPLLKLCREKGIRCVWLGDTFAPLMTTVSPYGFPNTEYNKGHLNPLGHQRVGECLARELLELHSRGVL